MRLELVNQSKLPTRRRGSDAVGEMVGAFESETAAVFQRTAPASEHIILYVLVTMMVVAFGLMAVVKLDRVVNGIGRVVTAAGSIYLSPFDTGIVRQVYVKVGDVVKKDQPLAALDPTFTRADLLQLQHHLESSEAAVAREGSEVSERPYEFSSADSYQAIQGGIWHKRQVEYRSNLANFDGQIRGIEAQVAQYQADAEKYEKRLKLAGDVEGVYQPLLEKGYVSKLQLMQATDERTEMSRLLADARSQMTQFREMLSSQKALREVFIQKWHSDAAAQLIADRNDLDVTRQNLDKAQKLSDLTTLNSPADAIVLKIGKVSTDSVAPGGGTLNQDPLFTLVPLDAPMEADVNIRTEDLGFIRVGDPVQLKLDAYRYVQHGTAKGVIKTVSEGSFTVDDNGTPVDPYFKVRITIKDAHLRNVPADFRLIPGMTITGDIMVGKRTILSYLVEGVMRTGSEAMREP